MSDEARSTLPQQELLPSEDLCIETTSLHHVARSETAGALEFVRTTRQKVLSKFMDSEEVQSGRAIDLKAKRAGHLGDLRKRLKFVQRLISEHASEEVIQGVDDYESALHRFVDAHETYLKFEDNEEMVNTANESYEKEKENTFLLDVELNMWKLKMKHNTKGMLRSVHKSRRSRKTGRSSNSSRSSVRDKRRILEEAQLKVEVLERKQSLERRLEEEKVDFKRRELKIAEDRERSKAELARKIERM